VDLNVGRADKMLNSTVLFNRKKSNFAAEML
jgi:hypothetical protein